jgi:hypothetical protein
VLRRRAREALTEAAQSGAAPTPTAPRAIEQRDPGDHGEEA